MFRAPRICSKPSSEHLDTLRELARPVGSVRETPREVVEATILCLCEGGTWPMMTWPTCTRTLRPVVNRAFIPAFRKSYLLLPVIRTHTDLFPRL